MLKNQELASQVLDALYTLQEAAISLLNYMDGTDSIGFKKELSDVSVFIDTIIPYAKEFAAEDSHISLLVACQCMQGSIFDIQRFYGVDMERCRSKIQFELLPIAEAEYDLFYYWGMVYPDPERMKKYYDEEYIPLNVNRYTEEAVQTGTFKYKVSIGVLAYNHLDVTKQCVESLLENLPTSFSYELILVNHGSTDGTKSFFESIRPNKQVDFVVNSPSGLIGYVRNRIVEGEYLLWISNDVFVTPHAIENLVACMDSNPKTVWAVPATSNVSNYQSLPISYNTKEELYKFCEKNNQRNPRKWEKRVRLCNPIDILRCEARFSSKGIGYLKPHADSIIAFPDDITSLYLRRQGYHMRLVKDAYCHHMGSVTINQDPEVVQKQNEFYANGRREFERQFGVDPWGLGVCYSKAFMNCVLDHDIDKAEILGINCGLGSNSLKIQEQLKEYYGNFNTHLFNITDDPKFLNDLSGISEDTAYVTTKEELEAFLADRAIRYLVWEDIFLEEIGFQNTWNICRRNLVQGRSTVLMRLNDQNAAFLQRNGTVLDENWYQIKL